MNIHHSGQAFERLMEVKLRELLNSVGWLGEFSLGPTQQAGQKDAGFDLLATLPLPMGAQAVLCVKCKKEVKPSNFPKLLEQSMHWKVEQPASQLVRVLALPWVSPRVAELCADHGWSWYDLAGNCRMDVPGLLRIERSGNAPVHAVPRPVANLGTKEAARVMRSLLFEPERIGQPWTQRALSNCWPVATVSLGLVNKMVRHLKDEGFIEPLPKSGFMVTDPLKLLFAWRDAYRLEQHARYDYFTLLQGKQLSESIIKLSNFHTEAECAAFSAADFQAPNVRQPKTWLYVTSKALDRFAQVAQAKPVDSGGNLVVLVPSDNGVFYKKEYPGDNEHRPACTNAVQTYVDLWHCGGRGQEAAEALLEQKIKPAWRASGLKA